MATITVAIVFLFLGPDHRLAVADENAPDNAPVVDEVQLKDGGFVNGQIVEFVPGSHVTIRSSAGNNLRFPLDQVANARRQGRDLPLGSGGPGPDETPAVRPVPVGTPPEPTGAAPAREIDRLLQAVPGPRVGLELRSNVPASLQRRIGHFGTNDSSAYHVVCQLPCQVTLPVDDPQPYRVSDLRLEPTDWFSPPKEDSVMDVDLVSRIWTIWAPGLASMGAVFNVIGATLFLLNRTDVLPGDGWKWTGIGFSIGAGALYTSAIGVWLFRPETQYELRPR